MDNSINTSYWFQSTFHPKLSKYYEKIEKLRKRNLGKKEEKAVDKTTEQNEQESLPQKEVPKLLSESNRPPKSIETIIQTSNTITLPIQNQQKEIKLLKKQRKNLLRIYTSLNENTEKSTSENPKGETDDNASQENIHKRVKKIQAKHKTRLQKSVAVAQTEQDKMNTFLNSFVKAVKNDINKKL
ncbi:MAG: hypothetical protein AAGI07_07335 [Bacteroidota bacterium]